MKCKHCGMEVSPFAKKCSHCGQEKYQSEADDFVYEPFIEEVEVTKKEGQEELEEAVKKEASSANSNNRSKWYISIAVTIVLVMSVCGWEWYNSKEQYVGTEGIVYTKEDEMKILYPESNKSEVLAKGSVFLGMNNYGWQTSYEDTGAFLQYTSDQTKMVYQGETVDVERMCQTLYYKENKIGGKIHIIADDVDYFVLSKEDHVIYHNMQGDVYLYNIEDDSTTQLASDVEAFNIDETKTYIIYYLATESTYIQDINQEMEPFYLPLNGNDSSKSKDFTKIVLLEEGNLFLVEDFTKKTLIAENVASYECLLEQDPIQIFYYEMPEESMTYYSFIEDMMLEKDMSMEEPQAADYPRGKEDTGYIQAVEEYEKKEIRDNIRNALKSDVVDGEVAKLYHYSNGTTKLIHDSAILSVRYGMDMEEDSPYRFSVQEGKEFAKFLFEGDEVYQDLHDQVEEYYNNTFLATVNDYAYVEGELLYLAKSLNNSYAFDVENKWIYIYESSSNEEEYHTKVRRVSYDKESFGETEDCIEIDAECYIYKILNDYVLIHVFTGDSDGYAIWTKEGGLKELQGSMYWTLVETKEGQSLMYMDYRGGSGKLYLIGKDGVPVKFCDNVYSFYAKSEEEVYIITDYESAKLTGTLKKYTGNGELVTLDEEVSHLMFEKYAEYYWEYN